MQIGTPIPAQPGSLGATNANGWVYGLFELAIVVAFVLIVTMPFWVDRFINWFSKLLESPRKR